MKLTIKKERKCSGRKACVRFSLDGNDQMTLLGLCEAVGLAITTENALSITMNSSSANLKCENGRHIDVVFGGVFPFDPEAMTATELATNLSHKLRCIREVVEKTFPVVEETSAVVI